MSTATDKKIYAFESNFELAVRGILQAAGYERTFVQGANETLPESRIEVIFSSGEAINEASVPALDGAHVYDFFSGRLQLRIVTVRSLEEPSLTSGIMSMHEEWAAGVRTALQERLSPFTTANLPLYAVKTIRQIGTARDLDPRWMEDFTRIDFLIEFGIRSTAWEA